MKIINLFLKKKNYKQKSSRNHIKMQKSVIFTKKNMNAKNTKNKYFQDKKYRKVRHHCHYTGE